MSYGLEADSVLDGNTLLSSDLPKLIYVGKGVAFSYQYGWYDIGTTGLCWVYRYILPNAPSEALYTTPTKRPVVFAYASPETYLHMSEHYLYTFEDNSQAWVMSYWSSVEIAPELYVFYDSTGEPASGDQYGMQLYDANENLTFDSGWKVAMVKDIISIAGTTGSTAQASITINKPAIRYYNASLKIDAPGGYWLFSNNMLKHSSSNLFTLTEHWTHGVTGPYSPAPDYYFHDSSIRYIPIIDGSDYD